jgi:RNA-directed DNA polymerase
LSVDEINTANNRKDRIAHGFKRKRSIITNARQHSNRRYVFNIDLEDFFPSINFGRVRGFFIRDKGFALNDDVATVIAQIACHEDALPQGSPCSPVVSVFEGRRDREHWTASQRDEFGYEFGGGCAHRL